MRLRAEKTSIRLLGWALACLPLACGGAQTDGDDAREPASGDDDALEADDEVPSSSNPPSADTPGEAVAAPVVAEAKGELVIPMRALDTAAVGILFAKENDGTWTNPYGAQLDFALGEAYPDMVDVDLRDLVLAEVEEGLELRTVEVDRAGFDASVVDGDTFRVTLHEEGEFVVRLSGEHGGEPAGTFETEVSVAVRTVGSVVLAGCGPDGGAALLGFEAAPGWLRVLSPDGTIFTPANADAGRPVTVTVHASAETHLRAEDGLGTLVAEGPPQFVDVTSEWGDVGTFELVEPHRVDGIDAWYYLTASWTRGLSLETGMTQNVVFDDPGIVSIEPRLSVDGRDLCTPLEEEWFEVVSVTPDVCPLAPSGEQLAGDARLVDGASVVAPGRCELTIRAPMFGAAGISTALLVDFID